MGAALIVADDSLLQFLHFQTKLASPRLPLSSLSSWVKVSFHTHSLRCYAALAVYCRELNLQTAIRKYFWGSSLCKMCTGPGRYTRTGCPLCRQAVSWSLFEASVSAPELENSKATHVPGQLGCQSKRKHRELLQKIRIEGIINQDRQWNTRRDRSSTGKSFGGLAVLEVLGDLSRGSFTPLDPHTPRVQFPSFFGWPEH